MTAEEEEKEEERKFVDVIKHA